MRSTLFAAITVSISVTSSGSGGAAVIKWSTTSYPYDHGNYPSVAQGPAFNFCLGGGCAFVNIWADVHQGDLYDLWYHVNGQSGYLYDHGYLPTVATDTWGNYIEIHQAISIPSPLWSKIGFDNGSGAPYMLNSASQNDFGYSPVIAVHGHNCTPPTPNALGVPAFAHIIQVHQSDFGASPLWMNFAEATNIDCNNHGYVGTPQWGGVRWFGGRQYATGFYPSVAINSFAAYGACVLEVHQDGPGFGTVRWQSGLLNVSGSSWSFSNKASGSFSSAQHASVCIFDGYGTANFWDTGVLVMELDDGSLVSVDGKIGYDEPTGVPCVWKTENFQQYDRGANPRISCQSGILSGRGGVQGVEVHQGASTSGSGGANAVPLWTRSFTE
jgi:hypothetical protein